MDDLTFLTRRPLSNAELMATAAKQRMKAKEYANGQVSIIWKRDSVRGPTISAGILRGRVKVR